MIGFGLHIGNRVMGGGGAAFDADAQAFFSRVTAAGGTLTGTEQTAVNTLVVQMKADGTWTPMKAIYPMVGASAAACAQNLKSSSFTGTFTSGWTFASTGITGNGTSTSFNTTLVPSTSLNLNSGHLSIYIRTNIEAADCDFGSDSASSGTPSGNEQVILSRFTGLGFVGVYGSYNGQVPNSNSQGMYITNRNSSTNTSQYKNGINVRDVTQTTGLATNALTIGAQSGRIRYTSRQYAFASIGDGLTDTQASNLYTAVQTFQTTLSRQV
jgi:hypothetical protein